MAHDAVLQEIRRLDPVDGSPADRVPDVAPGIPVGHDAIARAGAVPGVRGRQGHGAAGRHRRVHAADPEALRRHRPDPRRDPRARLRQRARQGGAAPHEPDARPLPDPERRVPLRPLDVRVRADPLERAVRLAAAPPRRRSSRRSTSGARSPGGWRSRTSPTTTRRSSATTTTSRAGTTGSRRRTCALARATRDLFLGWYLPKPLWPLGRPFVHALMDDQLLAAVGLPRPHPAVRRVAEGAVRLRSRIVRRLPARRSPRFITRQRHPTYPSGYTIEELGVH